MNYSKSPLAEELAKRYVTGTMSATARRRFSQLMMQNRKVQESVWHWEQLLNPMVDSLDEQQPAPETWQRITQRLGWRDDPTGSRFNLWQMFAAVAMLVVVFTIGWQTSLPTSQPASVATESVAILQSELNKTAWLIKNEQQRLVIKAEQPPAIDNQQDFELWMLPEGGKAPVSLGLLPRQGQTQFDKSSLPDELLASGLAVSIEPKGGSTTGAPTGPVILTARWIQLKEV